MEQPVRPEAPVVVAVALTCRATIRTVVPVGMPVQLVENVSKVHAVERAIYVTTTLSVVGQEQLVWQIHVAQQLRLV